MALSGQYQGATIHIEIRKRNSPLDLAYIGPGKVYIFDLMFIMAPYFYHNTLLKFENQNITSNKHIFCATITNNLDCK